MTLRALCTAAAIAFAAAPSLTQTHHDEAYLVGGFQGGTAASGIFVVRTDGSSSLVAPTWSPSNGFRMDRDNRHIVAGVSANSSSPGGPQVPRHGIYRYDPVTHAFTTIYGPDPNLCWIVGGVHVDDGGDYVFVAVDRAGPSKLIRTTPSGVLTTIFSSPSVGVMGPIGRNILNGNLLVGAAPVGASPCGIIEIGPSGAVTTFTTGGPTTCWSYGGHFGHLPQQHATGDIFGPQYCCMTRSTPGGPTTVLNRVNDRRTSPAQLPRHLGFNAFEYDLQTAASPRWAGFNHSWSSRFSYRQWIGHIDQNSVYTSVNIASPVLITDYDFDFYRGRHLQTIRTAPKRWQIRVSCPRSPGLPYLMAASVSGAQPAIPIRDGRRINLVPDLLFHLTLMNRLPGVWNPGPGRLDANGEAQGSLDLRALAKPPSVRIPVWIAVAVIDPSSPSGIRYIPDTWVMQV